MVFIDGGGKGSAEGAFGGAGGVVKGGEDLMVGWWRRRVVVFEEFVEQGERKLCDGGAAVRNKPGKWRLPKDVQTSMLTAAAVKGREMEDRCRPGEIRDAIVGFLIERQTSASVAEIRAAMRCELRHSPGPGRPGLRVPLRQALAILSRLL